MRCSRADVDDYFIDLFAPCWPLLLGLAVSLAPLLTTQMRALAAVPELAITALFVMELAGSQCLQGQEKFRNGQQMEVYVLFAHTLFCHAMNRILMT